MRIVDKRLPPLSARPLIEALRTAGIVVKCDTIYYWGDLYLPGWFYNTWVGDIFYNESLWLQIKRDHDKVVRILKMIPEFKNIEVRLVGV